MGDTTIKNRSFLSFLNVSTQVLQLILLLQYFIYCVYNDLVIMNFEGKTEVKCFKMVWGTK